MAELYIVADDLTGACDTGACFAQRGLATAVALDPQLGAEESAGVVSDVLVISTESRYLPVEDAVRAMGAAADVVAGASGGRVARVYKKIDSVLRGHPGAELAALMDALHIDRALVAPAFPAQGRTTSGGVQHVRGQPLEQTVFASEVATGDLRAVFSQPHGTLRRVALSDLRQGGAHLCAVLSAPTLGPCVYIADAETDADLATLTRAALECGIRLWCGSVGLATALADHLGNAATPTHRGYAPGPVLVVAGSQHPATAHQIEAARQQGAAVLQAPLDFVLKDQPGAIAELAATAAACLEQGSDVILTTAGLPNSPLGKQRVAARLGVVVSQLLLDVAVAGLVLTGGDIAAAACAALGAGWLHLDGEIQPGIAIGRLANGAQPGLAIVTKAGGFGDDQAFVHAIHALRQR